MKNNYIKYIGILIPALLLSLSVFSQRKAPGYMGKRFLLMYSQGISWSFGKTIRAVPNLFYTLQGDFAVSKKYSVGAEYSFRTRDYKDFGNHNLAIDYRVERQFMHKVGVYSKMFSQRNGHIAPAGPYFISGVNLYLLQTNYKIRPDYYGATYSIKDKGLTFDVAPFVGGGKQYIVGKSIVLDVSMRISLPLVAVFRNLTFSGSYIFTGNSTGSETLHNRSKALRAVQPNFEANILELRIGFGGVM